MKMPPLPQASAEWKHSLPTDNSSGRQTLAERRIDGGGRGAARSLSGGGGVR